MSEYRNQLENYLHTLNIATETVLDVGGASNPIKDRVNSWAVDNYKIADNGTEDGKYDYKFDIQEFGLFAGEHGNNQFEYKDKFNVVFCLEVFEYIYDPVIALENLNKFLIKGGTLYITFPTLYPVHNPFEIDYMRYTKQGAIKLLETAGFEIEKIIPRVIKNRKLYDDYVKAENYRAKGATKSGTLFDAGYIIRCKKI